MHKEYMLKHQSCIDLTQIYFTNTARIK